MNTTLELANAKVSELPEEAQERLGLELLDRRAALEQLRAEIDVGVRELDAGLGRPLDVEDVIRRGRESRAAKLGSGRLGARGGPRCRRHLGLLRRASIRRGRRPSSR